VILGLGGRLWLSNSLADRMARRWGGIVKLWFVGWISEVPEAVLGLRVSLWWRVLMEVGSLVDKLVIR
jgi:hypothetical protein